MESKREGDLGRKQEKGKGRIKEKGKRGTKQEKGRLMCKAKERGIEVES